MAFALPILFTLFAWWFSTGVVFWLIKRPKSYAWTVLGTTVAAAIAFWLLVVIREERSASAAYMAFTSALIIWAWLETLFLTGYVTGVVRQNDRKPSNRWTRVGDAVLAVIYHEVSLIIGGIAVLAVVWNGSNLLGFWVFLALWLLRVSAKLNIFLGVPNFTDEMLPGHLGHLRQHFRKGPVSLLFPISILLGLAAVALLVASAWLGKSDEYVTSSLMLVASLVVLGVIEHWFMVLRIRDTALWNLFTRQRSTAAPVTSLS